MPPTRSRAASAPAARRAEPQAPIPAPPAGPLRPSTAATRTTILDVAERICAEQGFEALSVRNISEAAKVNIAAITYHFGGKSRLFEEMFRRRVLPLNEERLALLDAAMSSSRPFDLQDVVRAFVEPPMRLTVATGAEGEAGNPALVVMQFLSRAFSMPGESAFLGTYYEPVRSRFILALKHVLPQHSLEDIIWGYNLMVGGIIYAMGGIERMERPPLAFAGVPLHFPHDVDSLVQRMTRYFAAALQGGGAPPPLRT